MNTEGYIAQRSSRREAGGPSADKVFQQLIQPRRVPATEPEMHLLAGATRVNTVFRGDREAIWRWGHRGPAVLMVHGWDSRASHLGSFVEALLAAGYQVVAFDGPGHGDSGGHHSNVVLLGQAILQVVAAVFLLKQWNCRTWPGACDIPPCYYTTRRIARFPTRKAANSGQPGRCRPFMRYPEWVIVASLATGLWWGSVRISCGGPCL